MNLMTQVCLRDGIHAVKRNQLDNTAEISVATEYTAI